jgi:uncharacterized protein YukE
MKKAKGFIRGLQAFMDSARGKTILNYLYSWGAAIVILGTLFKLTHMSGANIMLFVGMGTEVLVFFFSAFERPYEIAEEEKKEEAAAMGTAISGQPIIIGGPIMAGNPGAVQPAANTVQATEPAQTAATTGQPVVEGQIPANAPAATANNAPIIIGGGFMPSAPAANIPVANSENIGEMEKVTEEYIEQVRTLNEAIQRIAQQTEALGKNMEEMDTLSRNLTGVNALYEVQLRSAGGQLNAIDQVNEQTKKMAQQIEELNSIYARMIEAMTSNMNRPQI